MQEPDGITQAILGITLLVLIGLFVSCTTQSPAPAPDDETLQKLQNSFQDVVVTEGAIIKK